MVTVDELRRLIERGEDIHLEFKQSRENITRDVYDTVCSFSNRDGGHIILGVRDDGKIVGIEPSRVEHIQKEFVTAINNKEKIFPPLYLQPERIVIDGKVVLHIFVPVGNQACVIRINIRRCIREGYLSSSRVICSGQLFHWTRFQLGL